MVDVYSYAVILWELLSGYQPYPGWFLMSIFRHVARGGRPTPEPNLGTPGREEVYELIQCAWSHDPKNRPTFRQIFQTLSRLERLGELKSDGPEMESFSWAQRNAHLRGDNPLDEKQNIFAPRDEKHNEEYKASQEKSNPDTTAGNKFVVGSAEVVVNSLQQTNQILGTTVPVSQAPSNEHSLQKSIEE